MQWSVKHKSKVHILINQNADAALSCVRQREMSMGNIFKNWNLSIWDLYLLILHFSFHLYKIVCWISYFFLSTEIPFERCLTFSIFVRLHFRLFIVLIFLKRYISAFFQLCCKKIYILSVITKLNLILIYFLYIFGRCL